MQTYPQKYIRGKTNFAGSNSSCIHLRKISHPSLVTFAPAYFRVSIPPQSTRALTFFPHMCSCCGRGGKRQRWPGEKAVGFEDSTSTAVDRRGGGGGRCNASRKGYCCSRRDCTLHDVSSAGGSYMAFSRRWSSGFWQRRSVPRYNFFLDLKPRVKKLDVRFAFASCSMLDWSVGVIIKLMMTVSAIFLANRCLMAKWQHAHYI